jgi:hypothetical protein
MHPESPMIMLILIVGLFCFVELAFPAKTDRGELIYAKRDEE